MVDLIHDEQARVNVTWNGQNGDLPDPVHFQSTDGDIRQMVTESVQQGYIPGIEADANANFENFVIDRFAANEGRPWNLISVRPKTPFGQMAEIIELIR